MYKFKQKLNCRNNILITATYIYLNSYFHFVALVSMQSPELSSATQHAMPLEFGGKSRTECLNIRSPLPTLLCSNLSMFECSFQMGFVFFYIISLLLIMFTLFLIILLIWSSSGHFRPPMASLWIKIEAWILVTQQALYKLTGIL